MRTDKVVSAPMLNHHTNVRTAPLPVACALALTLTDVGRTVKKVNAESGRCARRKRRRVPKTTVEEYRHTGGAVVGHHQSRHFRRGRREIQGRQRKWAAAGPIIDRRITKRPIAAPIENGQIIRLDVYNGRIHSSIAVD